MGVSTISVNDAVQGIAYICNPCKKDYSILIGKGISKMFMMHGKSFDQQTIINYLEAITETYSHETPQTILLFLKKAAAGDFGKFYGEPDIGTLREWFSKFLGDEIIPERERANTSGKEHNDGQRGQNRSLKEYLEGSTKNGAIFIPDRFNGPSNT